MNIQSLTENMESEHIRQSETVIDPELKYKLDKMFFPCSVAIIGASDVPGKWGYGILANMMGDGYEGKIYPVNPKKDTVLDLKSYARVQDIPGEVDLAVITVPAGLVARAMEDCAGKGVGAAVVITSGFREACEEGKRLEDEIIRIAKENRLAFIGPNTMGITSNPNSMCVLGPSVFPGRGKTAVISQSGNVGIQFLQWCATKNVGVEFFAGVGNEAVLSAKDFLAYFGQRDEVRVISMYMEGVSQGKEFMETARRVTAKKPVIALKSGRSKKGSQAASSHSGAMAGSYSTCNAMFKQCGVVNVTTPVDLINVSAAMANIPLPKSNRAAIITSGGGWGVIATDECEDAGIDLPALPEKVIREIDKLLPAYWSRSNPVDLVSETGENIFKVFEIIAEWEDIDAVIVMGMIGSRMLRENFVDCQQRLPNSPVSTELKREILKQGHQHENRVISETVRLQNKTGKPIINVTLGSPDIKTVVETSNGNAFCLPNPEEATRVLAAMCRYRRYLDSVNA